eukprot:Sspe_Gene.9738::Locus_3279_Transcript_1_1_Confidence_1.000_Length_2860::g.9738::m.9738/K10798/PARP; poly [ADP-ribose] polymerase
MEDCLLEMEIDTTKMPLGKLSKATLKKGFEALTEIQKILSKVKPETLEGDELRKVKTKLAGLTNRFYTYIPHAFEGDPEVLDTEDKVKQKSELVSTLMEMEITTSLMNLEGDGDTHPIDAHYKKLKCDFKSVPKGSKTFKMVDKYLQNTHAPTHTTYNLELVALWEIDREGEDERYSKFADDENRMLLWHGSRLTNWGGIISQGLRIAPPEAPSTGYMFGKGVYFADMSSKSANYCYTTSEKTNGCMLLSEVALGKSFECTKAHYVDKLPKGTLSCFGKGKQAPDPKGNIELDNGCVVPAGKTAPTKVKDTSLLYNEFIVYDVAQIRMRYLLQLKFHYKKKCGTFF